MEIPSSPEQAIKANNNVSATTSATPVRPAALLAQLQAGQTLQAKVENILPNNQVELRIANQLVRADSPIQLAAGQSIKLSVEDSKNGLILRIAEQASQVETLARAWRTALPKQQPIVDIVKQLVETVATHKAETNSSKASNPLRAAIQTFINSLPTLKTISQADGLRQAVQNSGVTLEAQLRQSIITGISPRTDNNIKANFLRLAQAALQVQANTRGNTPLTPSTGQTNLALSKSGAIDAYTSLLSAATKPSQETDKSLNALRPLLPPLPLVTDSQTRIQSPNRLLSALPPILQRFFSLPTTSTNQIQSTMATVASPQVTAPPQAFSTLIVELINQMESGLARIQQHQLTNMTSDDVIRHFLNLELPVFNGKNFDNIGIRFEWEKYQQNKEESEKQHQWRVVLNFDFDQLGKTQVIITAGKDEINTDFRSEKKQSQTLFQDNKNMLKQSLEEHGLKPGLFTFTTGNIEPEITNTSNHNIVKTKA